MEVGNSAVVVPAASEGMATQLVPLKIEVPATSSPPSPPEDLGDDDVFLGDQDDAESFIQPSISPVATRLMSPRTPAAEKAAALDSFLDSPRLDVLVEDGATTPEPGGLANASPTISQEQQVQLPGGQQTNPLAPGASGSQPEVFKLPVPWQTGPKDMVIDPKSPKTSMAGVFGGSTRHQRASSVGESAMKRLSRALPSISLPTGFFNSITTPSFLSSGLGQVQRDEIRQSQLAGNTRESKADFKSLDDTSMSSSEVNRPSNQQPPSVTARKSVALRRSTSEDSILYHSLSRVSSFGDDERWTNIRGQVNSRFKAIRDSWDGPSFKLPPLPNILPDALKGPFGLADSQNGAGSSSVSVQVSQKISRDAVSSLDAVLDSLTGDVVMMGGYRGSILRSAQPPHRQLWVPVKVGLNIRKVNLEVGLDPEDEETMEKQIFASGMLQNIGPVDISRRLFKKLKECENARKGLLRVHDYGYDWRLSPHILSRKLVEFLEKLPSNQPGTPSNQRGALVIAHSLGGLITRHAVNQRPELCSGVLYAGTPQRCVNILGPIRNGDAVLLNEKVLTAQVSFTLRTTFAFLPEDGFCFIDKDSAEEIPVDFYSVEDWIKHRLSPCVAEIPLPPLASKNIAFGSLRTISETFSNLPLRSRSNSEAKQQAHSPPRSNPTPEALRKVEAASTNIVKDRSLAPQMGSSSSTDQHQQTSNASTSAHHRQNPQLARNIAYLGRTLAETKRFRAELAHSSAHEAANAYPPHAFIYGKETPTVWAARVVGGADGIARADAFDDLVFRSGDGVVLAREAALPPGYAVAKGGRVSSDKGHITLLADLPAVGKALQAIVRARKRGVGVQGKDLHR